MSSVVNHLDYNNLGEKLSKSKYYTINACGVYNKDHQRPTVEVRLGEGDFCLSMVHVKNWIRFVLHFVDTAINSAPLKPYNGKVDSGLAWYDPKDMFEFLHWTNNYVLTDGMKQVRTWFLWRLLNNAFGQNMSGIWSDEVRKIAQNEILELAEEFNVGKELEYSCQEMFSEAFR